ncbi:MAG: nucleoside transporter C-terminal domain-containing protein [Hyphomicrobiaceae bacterium]
MTAAFQSLLGVVGIPAIALAMSTNRASLASARTLRVVAIVLAAQAAIGLVLLKVPQSRLLFEAIGGIVQALQAATEEGMRLVFGYLAGAPAPFDLKHPANGFLLGFRALPLILLMSALSRLLYHWGVLQRIVGALAALFKHGLGISGPLATASAANIFLGMVEAPLLVRPYLGGLGRGALFATMVVGMATIAGTVMALYAAILEPVVPGAAGHVLAASLMSAPGALMLARLVEPDGFDEGPATTGAILENPPRSSIDALTQGALDGIQLLASVIALLIVMVATVALANAILGAALSPFGLKLTVQQILGWIAAPVAFLIGIPWSEAATAGSLIGQKIVLNELVAYLDMARLPPEALSPRSRLILTYALCGFANMASLGIMIGGMTAMVPARSAEIVRLAPKAVLVGLMATLLSGAIIGTITWT